MDVEESVTGGDNMAVQHCPVTQNVNSFISDLYKWKKRQRMNLPFKKGRGMPDYTRIELKTNLMV